MDYSNYFDANRIAWDHAAPYHHRATFDRLKKNFQRPDFYYLNSISALLFRNLGVGGKSVIHLLCNNGRELLSIKRLGAAHCVGIDMSQQFINQARELSKSSNIVCDFLCCNVYGIPDSYEAQFDIVYISSGSLIWLPDLPGFLRVVAKLLKPGGCLVLCEIHPVLLLFDPRDEKNHATLVNSYFSTDPIVHTNGLDYWRREAYESSPGYMFRYTLGDLITHCLQSQLQLLHFAEHPLDLSAVYTHLERGKQKPPMSYSLVARHAGLPLVKA